MAHLLILFFFASPSGAVEKGALATICDTVSSLKKNALDFNFDSAQGCRDQIVRSFEACFPDDSNKNPADDLKKELNSGSDLAQFYQHQFKTTANLSAICGREANAVDQVCQKMADGLHQAMRDNSDQATSFQLQDQLKATYDARGKARNALNTEGECLQLQAKELQNASISAYRSLAVGNLTGGAKDVSLKPSYGEASPAVGVLEQERMKENYKNAANQLGEAIDNHVDGLRSTPQMPSDSGTVSTDLVTPPAEEAAEAAESKGRKIAQAITKTTVPVIGGAGVVSNIMQGNYGSAFWGTFSTATEMALPTVANLLSGTEVFGGVVLYSTPAGKCDEIYLDPLVAAEQNCSLSSPAGTSMKQSAIDQLRK